jgi:hypothetical protein
MRRLHQADLRSTLHLRVHSPRSSLRRLREGRRTGPESPGETSLPREPLLLEREKIQTFFVNHPELFGNCGVIRSPRNGTRGDDSVLCAARGRMLRWQRLRTFRRQSLRNDCRFRGSSQSTRGADLLRRPGAGSRTAAGGPGSLGDRLVQSNRREGPGLWRRHLPRGLLGREVDGRVFARCGIRAPRGEPGDDPTLFKRASAGRDRDPGPYLPLRRGGRADPRPPRQTVLFRRSERPGARLARTQLVLQRHFAPPGPAGSVLATLQRGLIIFATHCSSISVRHAAIHWVVSYKCHCKTNSQSERVGKRSHEPIVFMGQCRRNPLSIQ